MNSGIEYNKDLMYWVDNSSSLAANIKQDPIEVAGEIIQAHSLLFVFAAVLIYDKGFVKHSININW